MTTANEFARPIEVLLIEDNPSDIRLTQEAFKELSASANLSVVRDVDEAFCYLRRQGDHAARADIILLDLNLPGQTGHEFLAEVGRDEQLGHIPVIVLTTSQNPADIQKAYRLNANSYLTKPVSFDEFKQMVRSIERFWFGVAHLPSSGDA